LIGVRDLASPIVFVNQLSLTYVTNSQPLGIAVGMYIEILSLKTSW
jgi:hypothetical protein